MSHLPEIALVERITRAAGSVRLPGSKSISNRALLLSALAAGVTELEDLLDADDTRVMVDALRRLGISVDVSAGRARVAGAGGPFPVKQADLFLGNAGTAFRPLTAALAFNGGRYRLDGSPRMRERPIGDLVDALNALGARVAYEGRAGFPPLTIDAASSLSSEQVDIKGDVSSQFVSGLLMAAPLVAPAGGLTVRVAGELISQPYVALTLAMMRKFGVEVAREGNTFAVRRSVYRSPGRLRIEGDASGATYFLGLGAIAGGPVRIEGVGRDSVQGDVKFADALASMGARVEVGEGFIETREPEKGLPLTAIDADLNHIPDAAMTIAVLALFADGPSTLRNIGSWRVKETDRIAAMAAELRKLGGEVEEGHDWLRVSPPDHWREATIDTYDDHRMAMSFSLAARGTRVRIRDPQCVTKTFPDYFEQLRSLLSPS